MYKVKKANAGLGIANQKITVGFKKTVKGLLVGTKAGRHILSCFGSERPRVLLYHRFAPPGMPMPHRVSADQFSWQLDIVCSRYKVISLSECVNHFLHSGEWPHNAVVITIDDGYRDFYQWAYPELHKRGLRATFFITTRFIDGDLLLWPDRLNYVIQKTHKREITVSLGPDECHFPLENQAQKFTAWKAFSDHCIQLASPCKEEFILMVEELLLPEGYGQTDDYTACSWEEIREMQRCGIEIGGHTCSHPILSKIDPSLLDSEISQCKIIIEERIGGAISTFCYPNSGPGDINADVVAAVKRAGFLGAVFGAELSTWEPYKIPRMGITDDRNDFLWKLYGGESIRM